MNAYRLGMQTYVFLASWFGMRGRKFRAVKRQSDRKRIETLGSATAFDPYPL
jgi:hypothetical protein